MELQNQVTQLVNTVEAKTPEERERLARIQLEVEKEKTKQNEALAKKAEAELELEQLWRRGGSIETTPVLQIANTDSPGDILTPEPAPAAMASKKRHSKVKLVSKVVCIFFNHIIHTYFLGRALGVISNASGTKQ